jgi:hypothetical protein
MPQHVARSKTDISPVVVDVMYFPFSVHINNRLPLINLKFSSDCCGFKLVYGTSSYKACSNLNRNIKQLPVIATVSTDHHPTDSQKDRPCMYSVTLRRFRLTNCFRLKPTSVQNYVCVSIFIVFSRHKNRKSHVVLSVACPAVPYFPHYITKGTIFGEKLLNINLFPLQNFLKHFLF